MASSLVPTGVAAQRIGVNRATLTRWWKQGIVTPATVTAGGHGRWDVDDLLEQLRQNRRRNE